MYPDEQVKGVIIGGDYSIGQLFNVHTGRSASSIIYADSEQELINTAIALVAAMKQGWIDAGALTEWERLYPKGLELRIYR